MFQGFKFQVIEQAGQKRLVRPAVGQPDDNPELFHFSIQTKLTPMTRICNGEWKTGRDEYKRNRIVSAPNKEPAGKSDENSQPQGGENPVRLEERILDAVFVLQADLFKVEMVG